MDDQPIKHEDQQTSQPSSSPIPVDPSSPLPDTPSPEEYLVKSRHLLEMDQPESITNNFLLFSPLLPVLAFAVISMSVIGYYVNQRDQQVAEIRSNAQITPCATGSDLRCLKPGDTCETNSLCVNGVDPQNHNLCACIEQSQVPIPSVSPTPIAKPTEQSNISGALILVGGLILTLLILIVWRLGKGKSR